MNYAISNAFERLKSRRPSARVRMQVTFVDVGHNNARVIPHTWAHARGRVSEECVTIAIIHAFFFLFGQPVRVRLWPGFCWRCLDNSFGRLCLVRGKGIIIVA
jgi:hypothetical protein